jgi:hypothetical protein
MYVFIVYPELVHPLGSSSYGDFNRFEYSIIIIIKYIITFFIYPPPLNSTLPLAFYILVLHCLGVCALFGGIFALAFYV